METTNITVIGIKGMSVMAALAAAGQMRTRTTLRPVGGKVLVDRRRLLNDGRPPGLTNARSAGSDACFGAAD
jgi:hypothetical protein